MRALPIVLLLMAGVARAGNVPELIDVGTLSPGVADTTELIRIAPCGPYAVSFYGAGGDSVSGYLDATLDGSLFIVMDTQVLSDLSSGARVLFDATHSGRNRANAWWVRVRIVNESAVDTVTNVQVYSQCNPYQ